MVERERERESSLLSARSQKKVQVQDEHMARARLVARCKNFKNTIFYI